MSVAEAAHRPAKSGRTAALAIGFLLIVAAAIGLAWIGAGSLRPTVTQSGLQFRTIKPGKGPMLTRADAALMDYILTANDGTVFDSSESHGGPQPFMMDQVFPGFAEAMTKMQEGGEYRFTMPQNLAFTSGPPPGWPKDSPLTFEVRVRKVAPNGATMMRQMQKLQQDQPQHQMQMPPEPGQAPPEQTPQ
jgi:FKBP-type peptidyl-prolyl cis-trans isomerase FkpA